MNKVLYPEEPTLLACEICLTQIPADSVVSAESDDYVLHFCGIECHRLWKERATSERPLTD